MAKCHVSFSDLLPHSLLVASDCGDHHSQEISRHEETLWTVKCPCRPQCCRRLMCSSPLSYLNSEGPVIPLKVSLNPNKTSSSLLSATSHAPCSYGLFYVWCCFVLVICRVGHLARLSDPLGHWPSLFTFILQLSAYNKHLINAYWIN